MYEISISDWQGKLVSTQRMTLDQVQVVLKNLGPMETAKISRIDELSEKLITMKSGSSGSGAKVAVH